MSTHLPLATFAASIGKGYPFRKNPRFDAMRRTGIFSCWDSPKPFYIPSLNIPFERRFLLHFAFCNTHDRIYNSSVMGAEVKRLHEDDEVQKTKGIYEFLLCRDTDPFAGRLLNLRAFDKRDKMAAYSRQNGICPVCGEHFEYDEMEGDHIKPWSKGGQTTSDNCQMLCKSCNAKKTDKY